MNQMAVTGAHIKMNKINGCPSSMQEIVPPSAANTTMFHTAMSAFGLDLDIEDPFKAI